MTPAERDNLLIWDGETRGHYEVYYLKLNDPEAEVACWLRYTLSAPLRGEPVAELWGIFFNRNEPARNLALKAACPWSEATGSRDSFRFQIGAAVLEHARAQGELWRGDQVLRWDLRWEPNTTSLRHLPFEWMYRSPFPKTKVLSPNFDIRVSGALEVNGRSYRLQDALGQQSHLWGTRHAEEWVWGHCNAFEEDETAVFEGLSARVRIGPLLLPPLTLFCLQSRGRLYLLNGPWQLLTNRSSAGVGMWRFAGRGSGIRIEGEARCAIEHVVGAEYTDPDGGKRWCHNTKVGDLDLTIFERKGRTWRKVQTLTSCGTCAIEWVERTRDARVSPWI